MRVGRQPSAVSKWLARGQLTGEAVTADGRINVAEADRQLGIVLDPGRGRPPEQDLLPRPPGDDATLAQLRIRKERLVVEARERAAAIERGELVRAADVALVWAKELDNLLSAIDLFIAELPAKLGLGLGRDAVTAARREWSEFRQRRAAQIDSEMSRAA